jgi:hypothetical protein
MGNDSFVPFIKVILIVFLIIIFTVVIFTLFREFYNWIKSRKK